MFDPKIKVFKPAYSHHDLGFSSLISTNFGVAKLVLCAHLFAGEKAHLNLNDYLKFQPMLSPAFQRYDVRFDSFVIPEDVHWKNSVKFYPQISSAFTRGRDSVPHCSINPAQLYAMVALDSVYYRGIDNTVYNPFSGSLIDDLNLPTFDDLLDELRGLSDSQIASLANDVFYVETTGTGYSAFDAQEFDRLVKDAENLEYYLLPFMNDDTVTCRMALIRALFMGLVLSRLSVNLSPDDLDIGYDTAASIQNVLVKMSGSKDIDFLPFLSYQSLWREYYRNGFVDEDDSDSISGAYLPSEMDYEDIYPYIRVSYDLENSVFELPSQNCLYLNLGTGLEGWDIFKDSWSNISGSVATPWSRMREIVNKETIVSSDFLTKLQIIHNLVGKFDVNYVNDYFTSASISAQAEANVKLPIGGPFSVIGDNSLGSFSGIGINSGTAKEPVLSSNASLSAKLRTEPMNSPDLGTIPMLRIANIMQEIEEKALMATGGRPYEFYKLFFGHIISDARLHRPTFISRVKSTINISEVTQTGMSSQGQPLGDVAGKGMVVGNDKLFTIDIDEPSYVMVIMSIIPKPAYYQGFPVEMVKNDPFDFLLPDLQHIGMRSIDTSELYVGIDTDASEDKANSLNVPFGFTDIYNEYRTRNDEVHGEFRSSMRYWTSVRQLKNVPQLNPDFIKVRSTDEDLYLPFAVTSGYTSHVIGQLYFDFTVLRPLDLFPSYSL